MPLSGLQLRTWGGRLAFSEGAEIREETAELEKQVRRKSCWTQRQAAWGRSEDPGGQ